MPTSAWEDYLLSMRCTQTLNECMHLPSSFLPRPITQTQWWQLIQFIGLLDQEGVRLTHIRWTLHHLNMCACYPVCCSSQLALTTHSEFPFSFEHHCLQVNNTRTDTHACPKQHSPVLGQMPMVCLLERPFLSFISPRYHLFLLFYAQSLFCILAILVLYPFTHAPCLQTLTFLSTPCSSWSSTKSQAPPCRLLRITPYPTLLTLLTSAHPLREPVMSPTQDKGQWLRRRCSVPALPSSPPLTSMTSSTSTMVPSDVPLSILKEPFQPAPHDKDVADDAHVVLGQCGAVIIKRKYRALESIVCHD